MDGNRSLQHSIQASATAKFRSSESRRIAQSLEGVGFRGHIQLAMLSGLHSKATSGISFSERAFSTLVNELFATRRSTKSLANSQFLRQYRTHTNRAA
jgi:hypothetical protein